MSRVANKIRTHEGNTRNAIFTLLEKGTRNPFDLSAANPIQLEVERTSTTDDTTFTPIDHDDLHPSSDLVNGVVVFPIGPPITNVVGTYGYSLTFGLGAETVTAVVGEIEVQERPGFPVVP
jgi:hypothetical protein